MKNKPHINIPSYEDKNKEEVKRILIEIKKDEKGNNRVNFQTNNLTPFEIIGILEFYKNKNQTDFYLLTGEKKDGEKLSQNGIWLYAGGAKQYETFNQAQKIIKST